MKYTREFWKKNKNKKNLLEKYGGTLEQAPQNFITSAGQGLFPYLKKTDAGVDKTNSVNLTS